jgi:hypothetical protein
MAKRLWAEYQPIPDSLESLQRDKHQWLKFGLPARVAISTMGLEGGSETDELPTTLALE